MIDQGPPPFLLVNLYLGHQEATLWIPLLKKSMAQFLIFRSCEAFKPESLMNQDWNIAEKAFHQNY